MILVSQYGDEGRMERVLVERPAGKAAERKFDLQTQERPEYFTLSETGVVRYFSWEGREFKTASVTFIDPNAMNIGNNVQQKPCIPTKLSSAAMELARLYDQLHGHCQRKVARTEFSTDDRELGRAGRTTGRRSRLPMNAKTIEA